MTPEQAVENLRSVVGVEGDERTVDIRIVDQDKATDFFGTMYLKSHEENIYGVEVTTWHFKNTSEAHERQNRLAIAILSGDISDDKLKELET